MATRIAIAVCTMRTPGEVAECLAALAADAPGAELAVVTSGLPPRLIAEHRASFRGTLLVEPRPGLSHARNRALAWAADADVLAFIDDDAVVVPGWHAALARTWNDAPSEVACIGGPIRPRYAAPPPTWLCAGIAHTLTLLDRGPRARELDPETDAVYGANVSFRVEPLRRIGGFDPALGHAGQRVYFGEEDDAQRALARLGLRVRYVPDAAVLHVIGPERLTRRSFIRRRFAYGAALGRRAGRGRATALRQAVSSSAGALTAAITGRQALAMERAVRAAENAGVLLGTTARR